MEAQVVAVLLAAAAAAGAGAPDPPPSAGVRVEVRAERQPVRIGDVVVLEVEVDAPGARFAPGASFGRLAPAGEPIAESAGGERTRLRVALQPFETGDLVVPSLAVVASDRVLRTPPVAVRVEPLTEAASAALPAKLALADPRSTPVAPVLLAALVASAAVYRALRRAAGSPVPGELALARSLFGRRAARESAPSPAPLATAHERALAALAALSGPGEYDAERFHERLKRIAVEFAAADLGLAPRERTTTELVYAVRRGRSAAAAGKLERVLRRCDAVQFAGARPSEAEARATAGELGTLVRASRDARGDAATRPGT